MRVGIRLSLSLSLSISVSSVSLMLLRRRRSRCAFFVRKKEKKDKKRKKERKTPATLPPPASRERGKTEEKVPFVKMHRGGSFESGSIPAAAPQPLTPGTATRASERRRMAAEQVREKER